MSEASSEAEREAFFIAGQAVTAWLEGLTVERTCLLPKLGQVWLDVVEPDLPCDGEYGGLVGNNRFRRNVLEFGELSGPEVVDFVRHAIHRAE